MAINVLYKTTATATGGRDGRAKTTDGALDVALALPKELGGSGNGNNPEQLFAAGYASCFLSAMKAVSSSGNHFKLPADTTVSATVGIGPREDKGFGLVVKLDVAIPGVDRDEAEKLVAEAHEVCPYSHATRGNIDVSLNVL
ncbi:organic hydroperoxide resistance protein [Hyphomonas sp. NPDC076900]|uniref:Organic hydroperoxide resistance protein n=1 Tax=Hyphomonas polymorpha PS728 TaxID=1280954 RepID=A0A062VG27_9PROT|nr:MULTISPECIES: organic hydroperoxide resistance protein [Hyphomonas]AXE64564.1 organic hydroperoxide resistance protein [Hyphomonas sp. CACIAM 19H1]KCZ96982.1 organic hydroperoxide resistance protein [Hyphomonas polymorpha PS728]